MSESKVENRTDKSMRNITYGIVEKIVILLLTFIRRKLFIVYIGVEFLGINGLFTEILGMLSMADLGLGTAMAYSFYKPLAEKDNKKIAALITFYKKLYNYIALAVAVIGIALVPFLKYIVNTDKNIPHLTLYYLIFLSNTVVSYLFVYKSSIISADQKGYLISSYSVWVNVGKLIVQTIFLVLTKNYVVYIIMDVIGTIVNNFIISYNANKYYPYIKKKESLEKSERKSIISNLKSVFIYKVSSVFMNSTDNTIISMLIGTVWVGYCSNYTTVTINITAFVTIIFTAITPSIGNLVVKSEPKQRYAVFSLMQMISFCLAGIFTACVYIGINDLITLWIGKKFIIDNIIVISLLINFYLGISLQPLWSYRSGTGLYNQTRYVMLICAIINVILSIVLGKIMGVSGVFFASFISKILTYVWYEPYLLYKQYFNSTSIRYYIGQIFNLALTILCILISFKLTSRIKEVTILNLLIKLVIAGGVSGIIFLIRYVWTKEFKDFKNRLRGVARK